MYIKKAYDAEIKEGNTLSIGPLDINFSDYLLQLFILGQLIDLKIDFYENKFVSITDGFIDKINCDNDQKCMLAKNIKIKAPGDEHIKEFLLLKINKESEPKSNQDDVKKEPENFCNSIKIIEDGYEKIFDHLFKVNDSIYKQAAKGLMIKEEIEKYSENYYNKTQEYTGVIRDGHDLLQTCYVNKN